MGMAASQARLLCITARIHDVEYQAQSIQNAKIQLATLSDAAHQEYLRELDDTTLTITALGSDGEKNRVVANFNTLCSRNRVTSADGKEYAIRDKNGRLLVEPEIAENYKNFKNDKSISNKDAYAFAMYMISECDYQSLACGGDYNRKYKNEDAVHYAESFVAQEAITEGNKILENKLKRVLEIIREAYNACSNEDQGGAFVDDKDVYDSNGYVAKCQNEDIQNRYKEALASYKETLYTGNADRIYAKANEANLGSSYQEFIENEEFNGSLFNYYLSIYKQIEACGGCKSISDFDGFNGDAASNEEWLSAMVQSGQFSIEIVAKNKNTGIIDMQGTSPSSDISLSYTNTTEIDSRALKKAEAKYENTLRQIDKKDKNYDLTLSKLETQRTALTTQYDSLKKVIDDNIERTFGIFS